MLIGRILEQKRGVLKTNDIAQILTPSERQTYKLDVTDEIPSLRIANSARFAPMISQSG